MNQYRKLVLYGMLTLCVMGYIFCNSLQSSEVSNAQSSAVAEVIDPIINPHQEMSQEDVNKVVRKIAHGVEFAVLGVCISLLTHEIGKMRKQRMVSLPLLMALCVGVLDEFIQKFHGRTDAVKDVLIDFGGAVCGMLLVWLIVFMYHKRKTAE